MKKIFVICIFFMSLTSEIYAQDINGTPSLENGHGLVLNGLGLYQDLGDDLFMGAIYLAEGVDSYEAGAETRLEMRIMADRVSGRKIKRTWMEAISLNSTRDQRDGLSDKIQTLSNLFQENYLRGDRIKFDYSAVSGTSIYVNQEKLGVVAGLDFYQLLMDCWIGAAPPSSRFKNEILNNVNESRQVQLEQVFHSLTYSHERIADIEKNIREQKEEVRLAEAARVAEASRIEEEALLAIARVQYEEDFRINEEAMEIARLKQERQRLIREEQEALRLHEIQRQERLAQEILDMEAMLEYEAEQEILRGHYQSKLRSWIGTHMEYPRLALQSGVSGNVLLSITSDREGMVVRSQVKQSSKSSVLDNGAIDTVERSTPFPKMPESLDGETFVFNMPIRYNLE